MGMLIRPFHKTLAEYNCLAAIDAKIAHDRVCQTSRHPMDSDQQRREQSHVPAQFAAGISTSTSMVKL